MKERIYNFYRGFSELVVEEWRALRRPFLFFLSGFLLLDFLFLLLHFGYRTSEEPYEWVFSLTNDWGGAEFFQYQKEMWCAVLFAYLAYRYRSAALWISALLCFYLVGDDMYHIHNMMDIILEDWLTSMGGSNFGIDGIYETLFSLTIGLLFVGIISWSLLRAKSTAVYPVIAVFFLCLGILAAFGIGLDQLHALNLESYAARFVLRTAEDGGEMLALSLLIAYLIPKALSVYTLPTSPQKTS